MQNKPKGGQSPFSFTFPPTPVPLAVCRVDNPALPCLQPMFPFPMPAQPQVFIPTMPHALWEVTCSQKPRDPICSWFLMYFEGCLAGGFNDGRCS